MRGPGNAGRGGGRPARGGLGVALLVALIAASATLAGASARRQEVPDFAPASGHAQVIAQGVVALPPGDVVWRTVRARAELPADALFAARPLGFVLATSGSLVLIDQATGEQTRLGPGEATLVAAGTVQQRASLGERPVSYLAIELVPVDAAPASNGATVLQPGQPFPAPTGLHDLDLVRDVLTGTETYLVPNSGQKNLILVTVGAAGVGRPGGDPVTLLAGEAAAFSDELVVSVAGSGGEPAAEERVTFVVAMIGPEVAPPPSPAAEPTPELTVVTPAAQTPPATEGAGSIAVQVFTCPPGMTPETLAVAVCSAATGDFDITLSGETLETTLTLADAAFGDGAYTWSRLPFGEYLIAEAVLPLGYETYVLAATDARGGPATGYTVTLDADAPDLLARIYNFAPAPS